MIGSGRALAPRSRILLAALLFSTGGAAIKAVSFSGWQVACLRSAVAAATLWLLLPRARQAFGWRPLLVGIAYAATLVSFVLANRLTTSANTIYLQSTAPLYLLLFGPWLLGEPIRRRDLPVLLAVVLGLLLVVLGADRPSVTAPDPARGNALALASGITYALMLCGLRWLGRDEAGHDRGLAAILTGNLVAALATLPMALPFGGHTGTSWGIVLYLGIFQIGVAFYLVATGLRRVSAFEASVLLLLETATNPLWAWLFLAESPSRLALLGGAVIIGATIAQARIAPDRAGRLETV